MNVLLTVAYDGTDYGGWQRQANALSVQQVLEEALSGALGEKVSVTGASRTDAGVHASCQKACFRTDSLRIPMEKLPLVLNRALPGDVAVTCAEAAEEGFNPRYMAKKKTYAYRYLNAKYRDPLFRNAWHVPHALDDAAMAESAGDFLGTHDFRAFCASGSSVKTTVRTITECRVERIEKTIEFTVSGNGFLFNMVRIMAGTLAYIGRGKLPCGCVPGILEAGDRKLAGITAPPCGLTLVNVEF